MLKGCRFRTEAPDITEDIELRTRQSLDIEQLGANHRECGLVQRRQGFQRCLVDGQRHGLWLPLRPAASQYKSDLLLPGIDLGAKCRQVRQQILHIQILQIGEGLSQASKAKTEPGKLLLEGAPLRSQFPYLAAVDPGCLQQLIDTRPARPLEGDQLRYPRGRISARYSIQTSLQQLTLQTDQVDRRCCELRAGLLGPDKEGDQAVNQYAETRFLHPEHRSLECVDRICSCPDADDQNNGPADLPEIGVRTAAHHVAANRAVERQEENKCPTMLNK